MQPIATDEVDWSAMTMNAAKVAEPIELPSRLWTQVGLRNHALDGGPDLHEQAILRVKRGRPRTCLTA